MKFYTNVSSKGVENKIIFSGQLDLVEEIRGPLELVVELNRCDVEMKKCEKIPTMKFTKLCSRLNDKKAFYYGAFSGIKPRLECPLKEKNYIASNSSIDLTAISFLPMGGFVWLTTFKINSGDEKNVHLVLCVEMEFKIVQAPRKKN